MNRSILLAVTVSILVAPVAHPVELAVGVSAGEASVEVSEVGRSDAVAVSTEPLHFTPAIGLRSPVSFFGTSSNWGYRFQVDLSRFDLSSQELSDESIADLGTRITGYSVYAVPVLIYAFNRDDPDRWQYRAGLGAGIGYLELRGSFLVTNPNSPAFGQTRNVDLSGADLAVGVYFEASFGPHHFVAENYAPSIEDDQYEYLQHNVLLGYRYVFRAP